MPTFRERVENNLIVWLLATLLAGFSAGLATYKGILEIARLEVVGRDEVQQLRDAQTQLEKLGQAPVSKPPPIAEVDNFVGTWWNRNAQEWEVTRLTIQRSDDRSAVFREVRFRISREDQNVGSHRAHLEGGILVSQLIPRDSNRMRITASLLSREKLSVVVEVLDLQGSSKTHSHEMEKQ